MSLMPKTSWPWVKTLLHSVYYQPDADTVHAQFDRVLNALEEKLPKVADHFEAARHDVLAFTPFPKGLWRQVWSNNPRERLNREIRLAEQHDEWIEAPRYLGLELIQQAQAVGTPTTEEAGNTSELALSA